DGGEAVEVFGQSPLIPDGAAPSEACGDLRGGRRHVSLDQRYVRQVALRTGGEPRIAKAFVALQRFPQQPGGGRRVARESSGGTASATRSQARPSGTSPLSRQNCQSAPARRSAVSAWPPPTDHRSAARGFS